MAKTRNQWLDVAKGITIILMVLGHTSIPQVISNFITNAIRHTPERMSIFVTAARNGDFCEVAVENEGSHIDEELQDKIWNRFYKVDKSRSGEGTGLGLSIAKNILNLHKAQYGVENTERGVKFSFRLKNIKSAENKPNKGEKL